LVIGVVLTAERDMHGPPLLIGFSLGALLVWRDQRRDAQLRQVEAADQAG